MKSVFRTLVMVLGLCSILSVFASCDKEDTSLEDVLEISDVMATAYNNGTITIAGTIKANSKIQTFELQDMKGNRIVDLMNDQLKSKGDDGTVFKMPITSANVKVQQMYLVLKTKGGSEERLQIGSTFRFDLGYGSKSAKGSYVSIVNERSYTVGEVQGSADVRKVVEFVLSDGGLLPASQCKLVVGENAKYPASDFAKSGIFDGTIITSTGCIATYTLTPDANEVDGVLEGVVINSNGPIKIQPASGIILSK